ncbi:MAG: 6-bladed beta-propeller, partial [Bacteroidales bacterium]|nr:6-bladed beta-propeller [Bacteroidales bacterium]
MKRIIFLWMVLCCAACHRTQQGNDNTIYVDIDRPDKASLFDYFRSVELIPMETDTNVLVQGIAKVVYHQDRYYALDKPQSIVFVFDRQGKYLYKISKRGNGPGEYDFINDMNINTFSGNIELLSPYGLINEYDLSESSNFVKASRITYPNFRAVHQLAPLSKDLYVFYSMFEPKKIIYYDLDKKELIHEMFEEDRDIGSFGYDNIYSCHGEWFFFRPFHTSVYKIGNEQLEESFRFDLGQYTQEGKKIHMSEEALRNPRLKFYEEALAQYLYLIREVGHNHQYVLAQLSWKEKDNLVNIMYDK